MTLAVLAIVGIIVGGIGLGSLWIGQRMNDYVSRVKIASPAPSDRAAKATPTVVAERKPVGSTRQPLRERGASAAAPKSPAVAALDRDGAFGFPQKEAKVLCDSAQLRFSVWNNSEYLFAQVILWQDGDATLGTTSDGRQIGDWSKIHFTLGPEPIPTVGLDRSYMLNPWPNSSGLRYDVVVSERGTSGIKSDTKGRGAIRYETMPDGTKVRVDTFAIPLSELKKAPGDKARMMYVGRSPQPALTLVSTDFASSSSNYQGPPTMRSRDHEYTFVAGYDFDVSQIPDGRKDVPAAATAPTPVRVAAGPPEGEMLDIKFTAMDGRPVDLAKMKGKVVLIDFWATWCGPCVAELPHVLDAYAKFHDKGFEIIGISFDSDRAKLERMMSEKQMAWPQFFDGLGWKNEFGQRYGIRGIPTMWLVNKEGKLASKNARRDLASQVEKLLAE